MTTDDLGSAGMSDKCLTPKCRRPAALALKRGLCMVCYSEAKKLVAAGTATWDGLVALGLALSSGDQDLFTKAFNNARGSNAIGD